MAVRTQKGIVKGGSGVGKELYGYVNVCSCRR